MDIITPLSMILNRQAYDVFR